jgi:hypothetical protein
LNYYKAREIQKDGKPSGKYHYTCQNGDGVCAVGYCSRIRTCPACNGQGMFVPETSEYYCKECKSKGVYYLEDQEVCPGHDTEMEACEHYRQYLLDKARYDQVSKDIQKKCDICQAWTQRAAYIPSEMVEHFLCDEHCNREGLDKVFKNVGWSMSS